MLKLPVWVDSAGELPRVTARLVDEDVQDTHAISGRAEPTASGLPGVVPTGIGFEMAGCWEVSVARGVDAVTIRVGVGVPPEVSRTARGRHSRPALAAGDRQHKDRRPRPL